MSSPAYTQRAEALTVGRASNQARFRKKKQKNRCKKHKSQAGEQKINQIKWNSWGFRGADNGIPVPYLGRQFPSLLIHFHFHWLGGRAHNE